MELIQKLKNVFSRKKPEKQQRNYNFDSLDREKALAIRKLNALERAKLRDLQDRLDKLHNMRKEEKLRQRIAELEAEFYETENGEFNSVPLEDRIEDRIGNAIIMKFLGLSPGGIQQTPQNPQINEELLPNFQSTDFHPGNLNFSSPVMDPAASQQQTQQLNEQQIRLLLTRIPPNIKSLIRTTDRNSLIRVIELIQDGAIQ